MALYDAPSLGSDNRDILDPETLTFRRAIKDPEQAYSICQRLIDDNRERNSKAQKIMAKYNDEPPFESKKLEAAGEGWRNNRSTGFMSSMIRRAMIPYRNTIDSARTLTSSRLRDDSPEAQQKNEDFRVITTRTIRQWAEWNDFCNKMIFEDVTFGYGPSGYTDEFDWHPIPMRGDEAFFPVGCPQLPQKVPLWMLRQEVLPHELADKLVDPQISEQAGWNIDNLVKAINEARPENRASNTNEDLRKFEDLVRESTVGASYATEVKTIKLYHLFAQEANGKVTHYVLNGNNGDEIFIRYDRFKAMDECLALLTLEIGNGKLHGSKGAGRILYNTTVSIEQARNLVMDNLYLGGLVLLKGTVKGKNAARISVAHPVAVINPDLDIVDAKIETNVDSFMELDRYMTSLAEMQIGMFSPGKYMGDDAKEETASKTNYIASIEMQVREGVLARFWGQFLTTIYQIQKRMFSESNISLAVMMLQAEAQGQQIPIDTASIINMDAIEACKELLMKGIQPGELIELANCAPNEATQDIASQAPQIMSQVAAKYTGNPSVNQIELIKRDIAAIGGNTLSEVLVIPQEDNTIQVEAVQKQLTELTTLLQGTQVPVSPRDAHLIHLSVIGDQMGGMLGQIKPQLLTPALIPPLDAVLTHAENHLMAAKAAKLDPAQIAQYDKMIGFARKALDHGKMAMSQMPQNAIQSPPGAAPALSPAPDASAPMDTPGGPQKPLPPMNAIPAPATPNNQPLSKGPVNMLPNVTS